MERVCVILRIVDVPNPFALEHFSLTNVRSASGSKGAENIN